MDEARFRVQGNPKLDALVAPRDVRGRGRSGAVELYAAFASFHAEVLALYDQEAARFSDRRFYGSDDGPVGPFPGYGNGHGGGDGYSA